jgi:hypothetical protein
LTKILGEAFSYFLKGKVNLRRVLRGTTINRSQEEGLGVVSNGIIYQTCTTLEGMRADLILHSKDRSMAMYLLVKL